VEQADSTVCAGDFDGASDEIRQLVELMNGLNRYRFAADPEKLAAWESARNVVA
jgi:hypothetical protein